MKKVLSLALGATLVVAVTLACTREGRADAGAAPATAAHQLWHEAAGAAATAAPVQLPAQSLAPLIKQLKPAVVNISTSTVVKNHPRVPQMPRGGPGGQGGPGDPWGEFFERYFGQPREMPEFRSNALGSGFIINKEGFVLTNNHVVGDATEIKVRLADGREFTAKVVGKDPPTDVALVKLEKAPKDLPTVPLGDSDTLEQGDFVLALGNPLGLRESASFGIVSAMDRSINSGPFDDFIQTDAAINPGNSGGPLFNLKGEVVGINTAIVSPQIGQGIGFAVPINMAKQLLPQLEKGGKVARGYLGVTIRELTSDLAQGFGLPQSTKGALVEQVMPKTPAAKAGVKVGDVVVAVNGKPVEAPGQLTRTVASVAPGGKVTLTVLRDSKKQDLSITVAQRPDEESLARGEPAEEGEGGAVAPAESKGPRLGLRLQAITPEIAQELKLDGNGGVLVADVTPDGPAASAGVQRGDVILEVNRHAVSSPGQVAPLVAKAKPGDVVLLRVRRGPNASFVPVRLPEADEKAPDKK
ncbi:MAG TPA: Do family serine endopeptidase [Anaeromyxobacteraceae bacterium]|nr:Do family serine endopeptidase [Anaeromyxobacteraceae bacterium]